ncbi:MAG: 2-C-methyl-D-erythritol 4-phosphate cytidylyltransferase [Dysgonamonadaceae bacterium]
MIPERKFSVVIVAGGKGLRAGGELPKQFQTLVDKPMLMHTIEAFYRFDYRMRIVIVLAQENVLFWEKLCKQYLFDIPHDIAIGGDTRFQSVKNGLALISEEETVGIHDGARPFVTQKTISNCYNHSFESRCGVIPVIDEKNSVRIIEGEFSRAIDRSTIKIVQTPQVFPAGELKAAYQVPYRLEFTDDATVAESYGIPIKLVEGDYINIKITTPEDFNYARYNLQKT